MGSLSNPIKVIDTMSGICRRTTPTNVMMIVLGLLGVKMLLATGLNMVGLLPLPTLSNKHLMFLVVRTIHKGEMPPRGRNVMRFTKFILLVTLVIIVVFGSVLGLI